MTQSSQAARWAVAAAMGLLAACAPTQAPMGEKVAAPRLTQTRLIAADGAELPLVVWRSDGAPRAALVALHGFNDYSNAFAESAADWARAGIVTYAYDQRGFGAAPNRGLWPGTETLVEDLDTAVALVRERHPDLALHVAGESMGAAIAMVARARGRIAGANGLILSAPAVRGRDALGPVASGALWVFAHTIPWLAGRAPNTGILASDNMAMLRALGADPLIIKESRVDAIWGLVNLMDEALDSAGALDRRTLILVGERDELIPGGPTGRLLERLQDAPGERPRIAVYRNGYHLLLRDLAADAVRRDVAHWILSRAGDPAGELPSGADSVEDRPGFARGRGVR